MIKTDSINELSLEEEVFSPKKNFYLTRILSALFLTGLFILPLGMTSLNLSDGTSSGSYLFSFKLPFSMEAGFNNRLLQISFFLIYFIPLQILTTIITLFIKKNSKTLVYTLTYISLSIYLFCAISCLLIYSNCMRWFANLHWSIYFCFVLAFIAHALMSINGIMILRERNPEFAEYKKLQAESKEKTKFSIKTKLTITIITTIAVILASFTSLILKNYKSMFTEAVSDVGRAQAEQTSAVYEAGGGLYEKIEPYFKQQEEANRYAQSPFERIDIITSKNSSNINFSKKADGTVEVWMGANSDLKEDIIWPDFEVFAYTTQMNDVKSIPSEEKTISSEKAKEYFTQFQNGSYKKHPVRTGDFARYIYPVSFMRKDGKRLVGFTIVTYREEILMKSYFHALIFVCTMVVIFMYLSIIITLFIADFITNPLLYLRTNVRKTSNSLARILAGNAKITADMLTYSDTIRTNDETKALSKEIKNLVNIIRGIIPYISFSTLQAAEKDKKKSTSSRELCFLFTDIRGFTSLCEGKQPREVVDILNHYLDIETEIILNNDGDVDKFVGDEMMAFFAGPKKEYNACKAAMEIRAAMRAQQQLALSKGHDYISMGIGINTGRVVFGSVGARNRMDFTSIGDTVNLAARLEGANKAYGSKAIITEAVCEKLKDSFVCRELDFIQVKGKNEPVRIYEILQTKAAATDKLFEIKDLFERGLAFYRKQKWDEAKAMFQECNEKYQDMPSVVFLDRISHFKKDPPPKNWDGVFVMKVK